MNLNKTTHILALLLIILMQFVFIPAPKATASTTRVDLLSTDNFAVLAGSAVSDSVTTSAIKGDVGLNAGAGITGLTCAEVTGTIYDGDAGYTGNGGGSTACRMTNPGLLTTAQNDLTTAYTNAAGRSTTSTIGTDLSGATLTDGVYDSSAGTFSITGGGTLILNGQGNADSVFIFKVATTLVTSSLSKVVLINGAQACNVYWQVGSAATLGTGTNLVGNVMALSAITDNGGSTVNGRLLARTAGAVTLNNTHVTTQTCAAGTAGGPALAVNVNSSSNAGGLSNNTNAPCVAAPFTTIPIIIESKRISPTSIFLSWGPYAGLKTFNVRYGLQNGEWLYNTTLTGFSTTLNSLPVNQPIWVQVAATNGCAIGTYSEAKFIGSPTLPSAGFAPHDNSALWHIFFSTIIVVFSSLFLIVALKFGYKRLS